MAAVKFEEMYDAGKAARLTLAVQRYIQGHEDADFLAWRMLYRTREDVPASSVELVETLCMESLSPARRHDWNTAPPRRSRGMPDGFDAARALRKKAKDDVRKLVNGFFDGVFSATVKNTKKKRLWWLADDDDAPRVGAMKVPLTVAECAVYEYPAFRNNTHGYELPPIGGLPPHVRAAIVDAAQSPYHPLWHRSQRRELEVFVRRVMERRGYNNAGMADLPLCEDMLAWYAAGEPKYQRLRSTPAAPTTAQTVPTATTAPPPTAPTTADFEIGSGTALDMLVSVAAAMFEQS